MSNKSARTCGKPLLLHLERAKLTQITRGPLVGAGLDADGGIGKQTSTRQEPTRIPLGEGEYKQRLLRA